MTHSAPAEVVVDAAKLTKRYGQLTAVNGIDLCIQKGEVFGLIGPDGAGKTTTFHMLGGILDRSAGELTVLNMSARQARMQIGYLTQQFSLYADLSVEQNLQYASGLRNVPLSEFEERKNRYLTLMDLKRFARRSAADLSGGMKQKLALCCALIARPRLLLLDEPTTGVDPVSRRDFWDVLATVASEGVTIAVATPYLDEAERCSRIALMYKGAIKQVGTPAQLKESLHLQRLEMRGGLPEDMKSLVLSVPAAQKLVSDMQEYGDRLDILTAQPQLVQQSLQGLQTLPKESIEPNLQLQFSQQEPTLENAFALLIKRSEPPIPEVSFPFQERPRSRISAIRAENLSKQFGTFEAVRNVDLSVDYGEIFGLLGANGAGKTTTIKMLCGLLTASSGVMQLAGSHHDLRRPDLRRRLGYMSQKFTLYEDLTVMENLRFYAGVYNVDRRLMEERIEWVIETCNLAGSEHMITGKLPGGFRQRLAFGATVLHQPEILFLDEPTSGVDPLARRQLWTLIRSFARQGTAVLVTTHFLEEAEHCHKLAFMAAGQVVASGSPEEIKRRQPGELLEIRTNNNQQAVDCLRKSVPRWKASVFGDSLHVVVDEATTYSHVEKAIADAGLSITEKRTIPFSLEDAFIGIVERNQIAEVT